MSSGENQQGGGSAQQPNGDGTAAAAAAALAAAAAASGSGGAAQQLRAALERLNMAAGGGGDAAAAQQLQLQRGARDKTARKERYAFWETQPVVQFDAAPGEAPQEDGPIDAPKTVADVRQEPYPLPPTFEWAECDVSDAAQVREVFELLHANYVEDDDAMFRFSYSPEFLQWALQPPGFRRDWHVGVRVKASGKLVAFISAIPAEIVASGRHIPMVEINFLCVHKRLRSKRLAPVLIKEITRRVNRQGIWQAAYTAGVVLPKPVAVARYWHRSLNPRKLIEVGFSSLAPRMTMARTIKLYKLPPTPATPGLRPMTAADAPAVAALLNAYLARFKLAQHFAPEEAAHWLTPRDLVVDTYVVDGPPAGAAGAGAAGAGAAAAAADGSAAAAPAAANGAAGASTSGTSGTSTITDVVSFYTLPSSVLGHPEHTEIRAAYMFYTAATTVPLPQLLSDAMALAAAKGYDVFNALDLLDNAAFLRELKFGVGDGALQYYLYNWRMAAAPIEPGETGLILL